MSERTHRIRVGLEQAIGPGTAHAATMRYDTSRGLFHSTLGSYAPEARRLRALRNRYLGQRCIIIGNGPSLRRMDLSPLAAEHTFGLNRIYLKFEELGFATTFLVCINSLVWDQFGTDFGCQPSTLFAPWRERERVSSNSDAYFIRTNYRPVFRKNVPLEGAWEGGTVTFVAMQLAHFLGFRQVILVGVDHSFSANGPPNTTVVSTGADSDHFDPAYFGPGVRWQLPDLRSSELAYRSAREAFAEDGREIIDATVGGKLDIFRKIEYESLFASS